MQCLFPVRSGILLIAAAATVLCADATRWGAVVDGLQLGIRATSAPQPTLHVILKNASPNVQEIPIGFEEEPDPPYNVVLTARFHEEHELSVFDTIAAKYHPPSSGPGEARNLRLAPGGVHDFTYQLNQLTCLVHQTDISLDRLLKQGYTVRATFGFRRTAVVSPGLSWRK
jgi:hypothetical protein